MGNNIGAGALVMTSDMRGVFDGLKQGQQKLASGLDKMKQTADTKAGSMFSGIGAGLKQIGIGALRQIGVAAIHGLGEAAKATAEKLLELSAGVSEASQKGRELNLSVETMQGLQYAADATGKSVDELAKRYLDGDQSVKGFIDEAKQLGYVLNATDAKKIDDANASIKEAKASLEGMLKGFLVAMAPTIIRIGEAAKEMFSKLAPVFKWVADAISAVIDVALPVFKAIEEGINEVVNVVEKWITTNFNMSAGWITIREVVIGALRGIAVAGAYCFDSLKVQVGAVILVAGLLVKAFGYVIDAFSTVTDTLKELPDSIRPDWVDGFTAGVDKAADATKKLGRIMVEDGKNLVLGFGDSANKVNKFFDGIANDQAKRIEKNRAMLQENNKIEYKDLGAFQKNSKEALSVLARFNTDQLTRNDNPQVKKLNEVKDAVRAVESAVDKVGDKLRFGSF